MRLAAAFYAGSPEAAIGKVVSIGEIGKTAISAWKMYATHWTFDVQPRSRIQPIIAITC